MYKTIIFTLLLIVSNIIKAQELFPKGYFRSPVGIPIYLAGNFGELRPNHFHAGIDIKTQGKEGYKIYAAADGFVSRVKISPWGYGKTIYIDHPNGYTTVYAHLKLFKGEIAKKTKELQLKNKTWAIDEYFTDTVLPVKKGDIIALSGNSGSSGGPHLHFEIRETKSEHPVNPLFFGFKITDNIKPLIKSIALYPISDTSHINARKEMQRFLITGSNGNYKLLNQNSIKVYGNFGIGIETIDKLNGTSNRNGIYSITLINNNDTIFHSEMSEFSFDETRYLNALIDYETKIKDNIRIQKSFIEPNNKLSIYKKTINNGIINLNKGDKTNLTYIVKDSYGNTSTVNFSVQENNYKLPTVTNQYDTLFKYKNHNEFYDKEFKFTIPENCLYNDLPFTYNIKDSLWKALSPTYYVCDEYTPLHDYAEVAIKVGRLSDSLRDKAVIVRVNRKGKFSSIGGEWKSNYLTAKTKYFGGFSVLLDTQPPTIKPINIYNGKNMVNNSGIIIKIGDNLSGIKTYNGYIDNKWIIMEYDAKKARLSHTFEDITPGEHEFKLEVIDGVGNKNIVTYKFTR